MRPEALRPVTLKAHIQTRRAMAPGSPRVRSHTASGWSPWPASSKSIATGAIEGACRYLIGDRLDITGARWGLPGAEAVLTLLALNDNGNVEEYWRLHLAREHERLGPTPDQHTYQLPA